MTHTIIVKTSDGSERHIPSTATLDATKAFAEHYAIEGQRVRVVTARGVTHYWRQDHWRTDTGRRG